MKTFPSNIINKPLLFGRWTEESDIYLQICFSFTKNFCLEVLIVKDSHEFRYGLELDLIIFKVNHT